MNRLEAEGRQATPEEQALLSKWVGWGASEMRNKLFNSVDRRTMTINQPYYSSEWSDTIKRAAELVKGDELRNALQSTQYAHYTAEGVVRGMWDAMERFGFHGGRILEPGMGIGHFFTAAPADVHEHSTYTGVEFEDFTAKIARHLLPTENIIHGDFTKQAFPDGFFDAAIGNPPFSATKILNDPAYKKQRFSLHDYFFAKSIDKVRPGGLLSFVTSRYTMDKLDAKARNYIAERADFIGAIRLPETAFRQNAGTDVVTDILFFQRRAPGQEPGGEAWQASVPTKIGGQSVNINEYFKAHPEMVLGKHELSRGMYRDNELTVTPHTSKGSLEKQLAAAIAKLPENIYTDAPKAAKESAQAKTFDRDFAPASTKEGGLYVKDGKVLVVDRGSGVAVEAIHDKVKPADHAWLKGYVSLRDKLKEAQKAQLEDTADWQAKLDALVKEYRAFTKKNGRVKEFTTYERTTKDDEGEEQTLTYRRFKWDRLLVDIEAPLVQSLERITDAGEIEDGPFLKGRTLNKPARPQIETVEDALAVTLDELGKLDLDYVGKLIGKSGDDVVQLLGDQVFQTPAGEWQTADEYLSGDVLRKLEEAQEAVKTAPELERNVQALIAVQPKPLSYDRIAVKLGAPWLRPETIKQFASEVLGFADVPISYDVTTAHWTVEGANQRWQRTNTSDFGTPERSALELLDAVLNNRTIKVQMKDSDGKTVTLADQTAAAVEAAKKISERFKTWLWEDSARTAEYVETYNRSYNNIAPRKFSGDHLTLPGLSARFKPHPHVKRAVWRIIQTGNTYLAHAVGAGKTAEQIIGGQEQRRLGLIKKPMHVVPNHMLNQFAQEFLELYPAANIMVADEQAFHTTNRQRFLAQAALNDPDAIIITHSAFGKIDTSMDMRRAVLDDMIAELEDALEDAKNDAKQGGSRHTVSKLEKQIEALTRRFEGKTGSGKDKLLTFDEMGVDQIILDEAHEFRKLDFATNRSAKGIDSKGSARALDLFIKTRWLAQKNPGRNLIMASGTPVTNTMAELFTVMRFMALEELERDHISAFDAWANMFGEVAPGYERNAAGGYEIVERFSKFVNVPELMKRVRNFMDVLLSSELGDLVVRPAIRGGGPQNIIAPQSEALRDYMDGTLNQRLETSRKWKPTKEQPGNPDPVINIITDARLASIDMRFVTAGRKSDPDSKLNQMIAKIAEVHHATAKAEYVNKDGTKQPRKGAVQIIFSPVGFGEQVAASRGFDARAWVDEELVRLGVKKSEIAWMSDANTHTKKEQLQKDVRSGKVRLLFGSPKNMGTGLNVQDRLIALHYLAPPWYPSDVTQPHGRIERQGNQNKEVDIFWYATEGTYDSTGWGMVARKQKFIDDAMSGDDSVRSLEDISEINMFEMAAALAAGDDRVIRIAELGGEVERLTRLKGAHATAQRDLRSQISSIESFELPRLEKRLALYQSAQAAKGTGYQPMSVTVDGQTYEKHGEAGDALKAAAQTVIDNSIAVPKTEIGKYLGKFPVFIYPVNKSASTLDFMLQVGDAGFELGLGFDKLENVDSVGLIRRLESKFQTITSSVQETNREIAEAKKMLEASKKKYGAPFPDEGALADAIAEKARLEKEMADETAAKQNPQPTPPPPQVSALTLDAEKFTGGMTPKQVEEARAELEAQLRQLLPGDKVALNVARRVFDPNTGKEAAGLYHHRARLIEVAVAVANDRTWTLGHEAIHAMRSLGLFLKAEWETLVRSAWHDNPTLQANVRQRWGHLKLTEDELQEEAVAEDFGEYFGLFNGKEARDAGFFKSLAVRAIKRVAHFITALARVYGKLTGNERLIALADAMRLHRRIESGEIGARPVGFGMDPAYPREGEVSFAPAPPTNSEAFKRWFGKGILKNPDGTPTVFYHGTLHRTEAIDAFDRTKANYDSSRTINALGTWFTDAPAVADIYAGASRPNEEPRFEGGAVYPVYINLRHPLPVDALDLKRLWQAHAGGNDRLSDGDPEAFRAWMRGQGYDGLIMRADDIDDGFGTRSGNPNAEYVVALDPEQVKSAVSSGFDPSDARISHSAIANPAPATPDPEYARRRGEAKKGIGSGANVLESAKAWWEDLTGGFTRHWRAMPNTPRFADVSQQLRKLEAAPDAAMESSVRYLRSLVGDMTPAEYDLFSEKVLLDDLAWDAGEGKALPFGLTPTKLKQERARVDAQFNLQPKLIQRLRLRKQHNAEWTDRMVASGVLTREQVKNPAYFRHMVLDYARHEAALARSPNSVKSPYWAKRMGTTLDINANLLEAELDWLQKAKIDVATAETIEWIKGSKLNTRSQLQEQARADNKAALAQALATNPAAKKEDGWFRSNIARGYALVKDELDAGNLDPIPPQLQQMADDIRTGRRNGEIPFPLFAWMLDNNKPGSMGAGMILKYSGLRKQWQIKLLGDRYVDPADVKGLVKHYKPEGVVAWQPKEGRHLFTAKTITESALDMMVTRLADTAAPGLDREELGRALGAVRPQLVVGSDRYTMALPEELAATLDEFGDRRGEGMVARVFSGLQSAWKRWVLINPRRFLKYNFNNQTGDLDAIIAGKPRALLRVREAWGMLRDAAKGKPSARYTEALERGVFTSGLSAQEIPDINKFSEFRHLAEGRSLRPDKLLFSGIGKVWRALQDATNFREALFRLAAYLEYADEIDSGKPQRDIGYGASLPNIVDAVTDPRDRAALLARDLIGDYGSISVAGGWLRRYLVPFWSWTEINTRRYWRLTANAYTTSKAKGIATGGILGGYVAARTAVALYARMFIVFGVLYMWNHLLFGDEEDELDDEQKAQLHMILGRDSDGKVVSIRAQGALSDVLHTLGFTDAVLAFNKWRDGQGSPGKIATDMAKAPVNRVGTAVTPLFSVPVEEAIGRKLWPDLFEPRTIHDKWRHLFQTVNLENEYDAALDRPSRGYLQSWVGSLVYKRDPGEMAYDEARGIAYDWLERVKGQEPVSGTSERSEALRDYRMALRYDDQSAAEKALAKYEELGGTRKGLKSSIKRAHPLGPIAKKDRRAFLDSLTDEQLDTFAEAEDFWQRVYANER